MRPSADHYVGRALTGIEKLDGGYKLVLEGDAEINVETDKPAPEIGTNERLLTVIMHPQATTLVFSNTRVDIPPQGYSIKDEAQGITEPVYPQRSEDLAEIIPAEPKERITE
jgi:hypothetical protein